MSHTNYSDMKAGLIALQCFSEHVDKFAILLRINNLCNVQLKYCIRGKQIKEADGVGSSILEVLSKAQNLSDGTVFTRPG